MDFKFAFIYTVYRRDCYISTYLCCRLYFESCNLWRVLKFDQTRLLNSTTVFSLSTYLTENTVYLRYKDQLRRDITAYVYMPTWKVWRFTVFNIYQNVWTYFIKHRKWNFTKFRPVVGALFCAGMRAVGRTGMARPIVAISTASPIRLKVVVLSKFSKSGGLRRRASGITAVVNVGRYNAHHYSKTVTLTLSVCVSLTHS